MRTQAAVLYEAGTDWKVEDIELDPPRAGEVLVRVAAAGLCHSEEHHRAGDVPFAAPMIGGHEGAGFVEAVGPGCHPGQAGRLHRLLLHPELRAVPVLRSAAGRTCATSAAGHHGRQADPRRHVAAPQPGRAGPDDHLPGRLLRQAHRGQRGVGDPRRPVLPARGRLPHRVRRGDRLGLVGLRGRRPARRRGRGRRRRRARLGGRAGRAAGRGPAHLRDRPGGVQADLARSASARRTPRPTSRRRSTWSARSPGAGCATWWC